MSSWEAAREKWELEHMEVIRNAEEAAANGDPEAMEALAYSTYMIQHNSADKVIALLTAASNAGRQTASWKLADYYANKDSEKYHDKIEHYCALAFAGGRLYTKKCPEWLHGSIQDWIEEYHPEWCEMEEGFFDDGEYYLHSTGRYGLNVFCGVGEEAARKMRIEKEKADALWEQADALFEKDNEAGYRAWLELCEAGNAHAAHTLGYCYRTGTVVERDPQKAIAYYTLAVERGYPSHYYLGLLYDELGDEKKLFETLVFGARANDASCFAMLADMTVRGRFYGGNSYVAAYLASRAYELDKQTGYQLARCYLDGIFLPVVYPYAKYCLENSCYNKAEFEEFGFEFPEFWDEIEAVKPLYRQFSLTLYGCKDAIDPEKTLIEGLKLIHEESSNKEKGYAKIKLAAKCGYCPAIASVFYNDLDGYMDYLRLGARGYGDLNCMEILAIVSEERAGNYYEGNSWLQDVVELLALREKLHAHAEMDDVVKDWYRTFQKKYDAMPKTKK